MSLSLKAPELEGEGGQEVGYICWCEPVEIKGCKPHNTLSIHCERLQPTEWQASKPVLKCCSTTTCHCMGMGAPCHLASAICHLVPGIWHLASGILQ